MTVTINGSTGIDTPAVTGITTPVSVAQGGTGSATLTANNVLLGNGTSALQAVAPGTSGNVLTSNGTTWTSAALPAGGVTSLNGQTGAITNTSLYAIGSYVTGRPANTTTYAVNTTLAGSSLYSAGSPLFYTSGRWWLAQSGGDLDVSSTATLVNTGTWRCVSPASGNGSVAFAGLWVRIS